MEAKTASVITTVDADRLFAFLSKVENHPKWATEFIQDLKKDGDDYKVVTPFGEQYYILESDPTTGIIDIYVGETKDDMTLFPTRVIALPEGYSVYQFTMFRDDSTPEKVFAEQYESLQRELTGIESTIS